MHFSTRQNSLSTRQCLCPLVQPVRLDNACVHSNDSYDSITDCLGPCLPNGMHFSTRQNSLSTRQCLSTRTTRTTRQLIAWALVFLMRCIFPLDKIHCRLDNACVHSYDSTTDCLGPCLPNEMYFSTRQNSLSTRQCLCPLVRLVRLDNACVHSYNPYDSTMLVSTRTTRQLIAWAPVYLMRCIFPLDKIHCRLDNACVHSNDSYDSTTDCLGPCLPNEMYFSTRQNSLSTRQCLCPLVRLVRLDNACVHSYDDNNVLKSSKSR